MIVTAGLLGAGGHVSSPGFAREGQRREAPPSHSFAGGSGGAYLLGIIEGGMVFWHNFYARPP